MEGFNFIFICDLKAKAFIVKKVNIDFSSSRAFCHFKEDYFLAGGERGKDFKDLNILLKITFRGETQLLSPMPVAKGAFPMTYFEKGNTLITLGGVQ